MIEFYDFGYILYGCLKRTVTHLITQTYKNHPANSSNQTICQQDFFR